MQATNRIRNKIKLLQSSEKSASAYSNINIQSMLFIYYYINTFFLLFKLYYTNCNANASIFKKKTTIFNKNDEIFLLSQKLSNY